MPSAERRRKAQEAMKSVNTEGDTQRPRGRRSPLELGEVKIETTDEVMPTFRRKSRLDTDEVAVAVRDADQGKLVKVMCDEGKEDAVMSIVRRAAQRFNKGVKVDTPEAGQVRFVTGPRRTYRGKASAAPATPETSDGGVSDDASAV